MSSRELDRDVNAELEETAAGIAQLVERGAWQEVVERVWKQDASGLAQIFDRLGSLVPLTRCSTVCQYLCVKRCGLVCIRLCGTPDLDQTPSLRTLQDFVKVVTRLAGDEEMLVTLVRAVETENEDEWKRVVSKYRLQRHCHLLCYWICSMQCRLFCRLVCQPNDPVVVRDLVTEVREAAQAIARVGADGSALKELYEAYEAEDVKRAQEITAKLQLFELCAIICHFFCTWRCYWICLRLCQRFPIEVPPDPVAEVVDFGKVTVELYRKGVLEKLAGRVAELDADGFAEIVHELGLVRYCHQICRWICSVRCGWYCWLVCPPACAILEPEGCVEEQEFPSVPIFRGVEIKGTATGPVCDHYTLEWREAGAPSWRSDGVHYPGGSSQGACGVVNGTLGWLATYPAVPDGPVELRLCVYPKGGGAPSCCETTFELARSLVWITGLEGLATQTPPGMFDPNAQLVDGSGTVRSFGNWVRVKGTAWVGGCEDKKIKRLTLAYHPGFVVNPALAGFVQFWQIDFTVNTFQQAYADTDPIQEESLTSVWQRLRVPVGFPPVWTTVANTLQDSRWNTLNPVLHHVEPVDPPSTPSPATWTSTPLPLPNCQSGKYTLRLSVEDTAGGVEHDLQQVWFDNKVMTASHAKISQIAGVPVCKVLNLSQFAAPGNDCGVPWPAQLLGIAYDEYIEEGNATAPSDNFGGYRIWVKKNGAPNPGLPVPIPGPGGGAFVGTSRVGTPDPADRCSNPVPAPGLLPPETDGILTVLDMRRFDAVCNPSEPALTLPRGECCDYVLSLEVWDTSICPGLSNDRHERWHTFPVRICNDLG